MPENKIKSYLEKFKLNKSDIKEAKKVFNTRKYFWVFVLGALASFVLFYIAMLATNSFSLANFIEMNGAIYTYANLILLGVISIMFGLFVGMSVYRYDKIKMLGEKNSAISTVGFLSALFSAGCPTCGSLLLPLIGISGLAVFPFQGLELKALSIILLALVDIRVVKTLKSCATCKVKPSRPMISPNMDKVLYVGIFVIGALILFNQAQIADISSSFDFEIAMLKGGASLGSEGNLDVSGVDVSQINSTAMAVGLLFPVSKITNENDAIAMMISTGSPPYSAAMGGISFDDPVNSMEYLAKWFPTIKAQVKANNPGAWQRYLNLATQPRGVSCEFCCGIGPIGATAEGESACGCKHNPAVLALTLGLLDNTDYSDAEVLREVMKWKSMFFPKNMVGLAMQVAGTDPSQLKDLPGMVGGC